MPIYQCISPEGLLDDAGRARVAEEITRIHCDATGVPPSFVNVMFLDVPSGKYFVAGKPAAHSVVSGAIRVGRTDDEVGKYLLLSNHLDGRGALRGVMTPTRLWCGNQLRARLRDGARSGCRGRESKNCKTCRDDGRTSSRREPCARHGRRKDQVGSSPEVRRHHHVRARDRRG